MDNVKHTPGPWMIHPDYKNNECTIVRPEDGGNPWISRDVAIASGEKTVAHANFWTAEGGFPRVDNEAEMLANARRIVACVNACDGIPNEQLECDEVEFVRIFNERNTLKQQRDQLLEALTKQLGFLNVLAGTIPLTESPTHRRISIQQEEVRAAIAKATGGA